ncbi:hypothetical protein PENNAL_c0090G09382 [Penicillium nalgiovense]|uniref:N-acetyltransferase domain-containing protein n=1 Tax=Penicillium nalgiovense TaxID=60175 RepID=A0A1V6XDW3_PENNA|nr:hypothetical protein PENNAL_c0090G09382 [Penicillium nalgiovense]
MALVTTIVTGVTLVICLGLSVFYKFFKLQKVIESDASRSSYFEIFWMCEDCLGHEVDDAKEQDRGIRFCIGNDEFTRAQNLALLLTSAIQYCWLSDQRTQSVWVEVRADTEGVLACLQNDGFIQSSKVKFSHEHYVIMEFARD